MTAMPAACTGCARTLRDSRTPADKHPGTVCYAGKGLCVTCRGRAGKVGQPKATHCDHCGRAVRNGPRRGPDDDSVYYAGNGECANCRKQRLRSKVPGELYPDISAEQHRHTVAGHAAWLAERRKRGVPADGFQVEDEPDAVTQILTARPHKTPSQRRAIARLVEQLENERAGVARDTRAQEARHRNQYGIVA